MTAPDSQHPGGADGAPFPESSGLRPRQVLGLCLVASHPGRKDDGAVANHARAVLRLVTPLRLKRQGHLVGPQHFTPGDLVFNLLTCLELLAEHHGGDPAAWDWDRMRDATATLTLKSPPPALARVDPLFVTPGYPDGIGRLAGGR